MSSRRTKPSIDVIAELYRSGMTIAEVADHLGWSSSWIFNQLVAAGIDRRASAAAPALDQQRSRPTLAEITAAYNKGWTLAQVGEHFGYSGAWIRKQLIAAGIDRRPIGSVTGTRRIDDAAEADLVESMRLQYLDEGLTLVEIADRHDRSSWWVKDRLTRSGVTLRKRTLRRSTKPTAAELKLIKRKYLDDRATLAEIATDIGRSPEWVSTQLRAADVRVSSGGARRLDVDEDWIVEQYVNHWRSLNSIRSELGVSPDVVKRILTERDIPIRSRAQSLVLINDADEVRRLVVEENLTHTQIADRLNVSPKTVSAAVRRFDIPARQLTGTELQVSTTELQQHLEAGLSNDEIAQLHDVATWAVTRRLRSEQLRRPKTKHFLKSPPPAEDLHSRYLEDGATLAEIAADYEVPHTTVSRWLAHYGIKRRPHPYTHNPDAQDLDTEQLRKLYVDDEWTSVEIADLLGVTSRTILNHLHQHGIPLRPSGARRPPTAGPVLERLYGDPAVTKILKRYRIPIAPTPGSLRERFPDPDPLEAAMLKSLYEDIGLSISQITLITGHHDNAVRRVLQTNGITTRPSTAVAPWTDRTR